MARRSMLERPVRSDEFEPEPLHLPLELPLVESPARVPGRDEADEPSSDAGDDRPRVIVIDLC